MADPFDALRLPSPSVDPDPTFATRLRLRVERALSLPEGVTVSDLTLDLAPESTADPGARSGAVVPYLIVTDARRALDWYRSVLGATLRSEPLVMADGRIGHAELSFGASPVFLADESPESNVAAPDPAARATVSLVVEVPDVDGSLRRALSEGASLERPAADYAHGRNAVIRDPFGHRWIVSSEPAPPTDRVRQGDIGYVSLWVPDAERAAAFFAQVLGWSYEPRSAGEAHQVAGRVLNHGVHGGHGRSNLFLCFAVDDVDAAARRVREAGGEAQPATAEPWGRTAMCTDVEGTPFALFQAAGPPGERLAPNGTRHGDVSYITMEVKDSAAVRAFYGAVLGWHFTAGRVEDGWGPDDVMPMTGLHGGHELSTVVPMYRVDDLYGAVARVRAAGGSATDPERQPYGLTSACVDDQGTRFYLGQH
jgi:predicted enzyme related to lactoylglutathione lyase